MDIARPPSGFHISLSPRVPSQLRALRSSAPWLDQAFADVRTRLQFTGHKEGRRVGRGRVFVEADPMTGRNRLAVAYSVLGDELYIESLLVIL